MACPSMGKMGQGPMVGASKRVGARHPSAVQAILTGAPRRSPEVYRPGPALLCVRAQSTARSLTGMNDHLRPPETTRTS